MSDEQKKKKCCSMLNDICIFKISHDKYYIKNCYNNEHTEDSHVDDSKSDNDDDNRILYLTVVAFFVPIITLVYLVMSIYDIMLSLDPTSNIIVLIILSIIALLVIVSIIKFNLLKSMLAKNNATYRMFLLYYNSVFCPSLILAFVFTFLYVIPISSCILADDKLSNSLTLLLIGYILAGFAILIFIILSALYIYKYSKLYNKCVQTVTQAVLSSFNVLNFLLPVITDNFGILSEAYFVLSMLAYLVFQIYLQCISSP